MARIRRPAEDVGINLTPMIDVVFLLVIFFMVGARFGESKSDIDVNLQASGQYNAAPRPPQEYVVEIASNGVLLLDNQPISLQQLDQQLRYAKQQTPEVRVAVRGEGNASFQQVSDVLQVIRSAGVQQLGIAPRGIRR